MAGQEDQAGLEVTPPTALEVGAMAATGPPAPEAVAEPAVRRGPEALRAPRAFRTSGAMTMSPPRRARVVALARPANRVPLVLVVVAVAGAVVAAGAVEGDTLTLSQETTHLPLPLLLQQLLVVMAPTEAPAEVEEAELRGEMVAQVVAPALEDFRRPTVAMVRL
jgi:hypothetical protein